MSSGVHGLFPELLVPSAAGTSAQPSVLHVASLSSQAEAAVAAVAVADSVRDSASAVGPDGVSKAWGRAGACTSALVTPAPGSSAGGSTGPSAAASFFIRYVSGLRGACVGDRVPRAHGLASGGLRPCLPEW